MKNVSIVLSLLIASAVIMWAIAYSGEKSSSGGAGEIRNVSVSGGTQYIDITAKGGYSPRVTSAKAGLPTVLRIKTEGTFDCSIALRISDLGYKKNFAPNTTEEIPVPAQNPGKSLRGICAMGMYSFVVNFE